ncbi:MAG: hypothetical protein KTR16_02160, partial [Acidiferrobacterales bacterium]|nr:hypothetical protein [Acidiferrobacterales bacterium]
TQMAINGAAAHAFAHIIYKALLFMSAGVVIYRTGKTKCTDLGGLFRTMPLTTICGIIGALAISGFPLTSGFVTKTLSSQAAVDQSLAIVYFILTAASAGVFLHAGIKFPWFVFFQKDSGMRPKDAPWNMGAAMVLLSALCIIIGIFPSLFYQLLPYPVDYKPYAIGKVLFYLQLLLFSGLAFFLLLPMMKRTLTISLDTDWVWRVALWGSASWLMQKLASIGLGVQTAFSKLSARVNTSAQRFFNPIASGRKPSTGFFSRSQPIAQTAFWIAVLLTGYVLVYYL